MADEQQQDAPEVEAELVEPGAPVAGDLVVDEDGRHGLYVGFDAESGHKVLLLGEPTTVLSGVRRL